MGCLMPRKAFMALKDKIPEFLDLINQSSPLLDFNKQMFDIYEGDLLKYVEKDLKEELSAGAFDQLKNRIVPINILRKVVDKLSTIYQETPVRQVVNGGQSDKDLLSWYVAQMRTNYKMNIADEFFNLFNSALIQPYVYMGKPNLRIIPNDRFIICSDDPIEPTRPTYIITIQGTRSYSSGESKIYHAYSDYEFIIFNDKGEIDLEAMMFYNNPDGINIYGRMPFIYVNRSANLLVPKVDRDGLRIAKLLPILLTDLAGAIKFQAWSIIYGIDVNQEGLVLAANAFWNIKSDPNSDKQPRIGTIKPEVDINEVMQYIQATISLWLNTKGIRPGAMGQLTNESQLSGISKLIDEMDTYEQRKKAVVYFTHTEDQLWDLLLNYMHPVWAGQKLIPNNTYWSPDNEISISFADQIPNTNRGDLVDNLSKEVAAGFMPKSEAIRRLNPAMTQEELDEYMKKIAEERTYTFIETEEGMNDENESSMLNAEEEEEET